MNNILTSWKTTLLGVVLAAAQIAPSFGHFGSLSIPQVIGGVASLLLGAFAKDNNVTGGTPSAPAIKN